MNKAVKLIYLYGLRIRNFVPIVIFVSYFPSYLVSHGKVVVTALTEKSCKWVRD
jgi:hypothetical protein